MFRLVIYFDYFMKLPFKPVFNFVVVFLNQIRHRFKQGKPAVGSKSEAGRDLGGDDHH